MSRSFSLALLALLATAACFGTASAVTQAPPSPRRAPGIVALIDRAESLFVLRLDLDSIPGCDFVTDSLRYTRCYPVIRKSPAPNRDWVKELGELFARARVGAWNRDGCGYAPRNIVEIVEESRSSNLVVLTSRCDNTRVGLLMIAPGALMQYRELRTEGKALLDLLDRAILPDQEPVLVTQVQPTYPEFAKEARIEGKVVLLVLVGASGRVAHVKVRKGVTGLNEAAVDAVKKWVFKPALSNNEPVAAWIEVPMDFHLPDRTHN